MLKELKGNGLLIHHWDTDGICATCLLLENLFDKNIINKTPEIGNYYLTDHELKKYSKYDFIIIVDISLPEDNILKLAKKSKIIIFDHHLGEEIKQVFHHNPVIKGENPDEQPSTSWIINKYLNNYVNLFSLLGIVGDHEEKIKNNEKFNKMINEFCKENNLTFKNMLKMVYLLDSNYKIGDKKAVEEAPHYLLRINSYKDILNNNKWKKNYRKLNNEINKFLKTSVDEINKIIIKKINTKYNIISTITRKIAWESRKNTIVINTGFFEDKDQIYLRSNKNTEPIITKGRLLGYKCGGKKEVLGAIVPKNKTDSFVKEILEFLKQ